MPKVQPDLQKFVIISAAVSGIGLFWSQITIKCFETVISIVKNQLFVEDKKIREQIENIYSLIKQVLEDEQKMMKALQDVQAVQDDGEALQAAQDVQELKNKIIEQIENICSKGKKLEEDCEDVQLENEIEGKIKRIKYFCSETKKMLEEWENVQEGDEQDLLIRLSERKDIEDDKIRLIVKGL